MVVLPSTGASRYHICCIDGGTSTEYSAYNLVYALSGFCILWDSYGNVTYLTRSLIDKIYQKKKKKRSPKFTTCNSVDICKGRWFYPMTVVSYSGDYRLEEIAQVYVQVKGERVV
jgi:hypothetical protein